MVANQRASARLNGAFGTFALVDYGRLTPKAKHRTSNLHVLEESLHRSIVRKSLGRNRVGEHVPGF